MMNTKIKYYCVWSEFDTILCLTTDYGIALDVFGEHMISVGRLTDDSWSDTTAHIEEFSTFPENNNEIMESISDGERGKWKSGDTIFM